MNQYLHKKIVKGVDVKKAIISFILLALFSGTIALAQDESFWWNERVFYEIFIRSFQDSDGDGIGDIQGVIDRLDYLNDGDPNTNDDLGITGIWLMPPAEAFSYHGYDVTDYRMIESDYGTNEDFKRLMEEAHARGIAVIIDLVVNHTSEHHPWFVASKDIESEFVDWYIWEDDNPNYAGPWGAPAWHEADNGHYYYGIFWSGMPDLDYTNAAVTDEMYDVAAFWLDVMGADGFRLDAIKHVIEDGELQELTPQTRAWLVDFQAHLQTVKPDVLTVGEFFNVPAFRIAPYVEENAVNIAFEFDLASDIIRSVLRKNKRDITRAHERGLRDYPLNQFAVFLTNHDQTRIATQLIGDVGANKVAATLLLTGPGVPFLYYGEEVGMAGAKPDERLRTPMHWDATENAGFTTGTPWEPLAENHETTNVDIQTNDADSLLNHYRQLLHLRNGHEALRLGELQVVESSGNKVYAFLRYTDDETILVLINLDDENRE